MTEAEIVELIYINGDAIANNVMNITTIFCLRHLPFPCRRETQSLLVGFGVSLLHRLFDRTRTGYDRSHVLSLSTAAMKSIFLRSSSGAGISTTRSGTSSYSSRSARQMVACIS